MAGAEPHDLGGAAGDLRGGGDRDESAEPASPGESGDTGQHVRLGYRAEVVDVARRHAERRELVWHDRRQLVPPKVKLIDRVKRCPVDEIKRVTDILDLGEDILDRIVQVPLL